VSEAGREGALLYGDVDPALSRQQDFVYPQGGFETDWFADGPLTFTDHLSIPNWGPRCLAALEAALIASR
jgi:hypothetical protein